MKQHLVRAGAIVGAATLAGLAFAPAAAAATVSQASANAITLEIAGTGADSGTFAATNDGTGEKTTGDDNPPIDVLDNQGLLNYGVLTQQASATVEGRDGVSRACAGVAGEGGAVVELGDAGCITPGQPVGVSFANLDLTGTALADPAGALAPLNALGNPLIDSLLGPLTAALSDVLQGLTTFSIAGTLDGVEARCVARPGSAEGSATIADSELTLNVAGSNVTLVKLPANPDPNTKVVTDLDEVLNVVIDALEVQFTDALAGALGPLSQLTNALQETVVNTVVAQIADALAPLEANVLDITLNKQERPEQGHIDVTALDAQVLPAAQQFIDSSLIDLTLGNVSCGPNGRTTPDNPDNPDDPDNPDGPDGPDNPDLPDVPTTVDAGAQGGDNGINEGALVAGLLMLGGAAGLAGYRRFVPTK